MRQGNYKPSALEVCPKIAEYRGLLDQIVIRNYRRAMRSGSEFPPLIADSVTGLVMSGLLTLEAHRREFGDERKIRVHVLKRPTPEDRLEEYLQQNAKNACPLPEYVKARMAQHLLDHGRTESHVEKLLGGAFRMARLNDLSVVVMEPGGAQTVEQVKSGVVLPGTMTRAQYDTHIRKDTAEPVVVLSTALTARIQEGKYDMGDPATQEALYDLAKEIAGTIIPQLTALKNWP